MTPRLLVSYPSPPNRTRQDPVGRLQGARVTWREVMLLCDASVSGLRRHFPWLPARGKIFTAHRSCAGSDSEDVGEFTTAGRLTDVICPQM